jgi:hypothetical protein
MTNKRQAPDGLRQGMSVRAMSRMSPATLNAETRSVDFVAATETPAEVFSWEHGDFVREIILASGMELPGNGQVPLLDSHSRGSVEDVLGSMRGFRVEGGQIVGTAFFAKSQKAYDTYNKVAEGHLTDVSVGYQPTDSVMIPDGETLVDGGRTYAGPMLLTRKWRLFEVSVTGIGADPNAKARSAEVPPAEPQAVEPEPISEVTTSREAETIQEETTVENENKTPVSTPPANIDQIKAEAVKAEQARSAGIITLCERHNMPELAKAMIADGTTEERAAVKILEAMATKTPAVGPKIEGGATDSEKFRAAAVDGMLIRSSFKIEKPAAGAEDFSRAGFRMLAREVLNRRGINTRFMSDVQLIDTALRLRGFGQGTSDFDNICANVASKAAMIGYQAAPNQWKRWVKTGSLPNFQAAKRVRVSDIPAMAIVPEGAALGVGVMSDSGEAITLVTYGTQLTLTRQLMINDTTDSLDIFKGFGQMTGGLINSLPYALLNANGNLSDSVALFAKTTNRGPIAGNQGTQGTISDGTLSELKKLMHSQTGPKGLKLNLMPKFLLCGSAYMNTAEIFTASQYLPVASTTYGGSQIKNNHNNLELIADANISGNYWFLAADPGIAPTVETAFLDGNESPTITEVDNAGGVLGRTYYCFIDATSKVLDFRGLAANL